MGERAQSAAEFIILASVLLFFFLILFFVFQENISQRARIQREGTLREAAFSIQNEITLAGQASEGYERTFLIPALIINRNYSVMIVDTTLLYLITTDSDYSITLPIQNTTGQPRQGGNTIKKINSTIYLNS